MHEIVRRRASASRRPAAGLSATEVGRHSSSARNGASRTPGGGAEWSHKAVRAGPRGPARRRTIGSRSSATTSGGPRRQEFSVTSGLSSAERRTLARAYDFGVEHLPERRPQNNTSGIGCRSSSAGPNVDPRRGATGRALNCRARARAEGVVAQSVAARRRNKHPPGGSWR